MLASRADPGRRLGARVAGGLALLVVVGALALLEYPSLLSRWEGFGSFPILDGPPPRLGLEITPGGFVYNLSGVRYGLLDLGYYTAEWLGWSLLAFRLPVVVAGAAAVGLCWLVAGRALGYWPGLVAAFALVLNPLFVVLWHLSLVPMISVLFLLLVMERVQYLERAAQGRCSGNVGPGVGGVNGSLRALLWGVPTLALAYVLLLLHYGPGRAFGGVVICWWAVSTVWRAVIARRAGRPLDWAMLLAVPVCAMTGALLLVLSDPSNVRYVLSPLDLLRSPMSEMIDSPDEAFWVLKNAPIVLAAVVPPLGPVLVPGQIADRSVDLLADYRAYLLPTALLPLFLLGLGVTAARARRSADARLILMLLGLTLLAPMLSSGGSISSFRMCFAMIPLSLCVAAGAGWLLARRQLAVRYGSVGVVGALLAMEAGVLVDEVRQHRAFVADLVQRWTPGTDIRHLQSPEMRHREMDDPHLTNGNYRYYTHEGGLRALVAAHRLRARVPEPREPNEVVLIQLDGPVQRHDPTGPIKLVFFLRHLEVAAVLFDPASQRFRGAGPGSFNYVIAANGVAATSARRQLEARGLTVRQREHKP